MKEFTGSSVNKEIAMGHVVVFSKKQGKINKKKTENIEYEKFRFQKARKLAIEQIKTLYEKTISEIGEDEADIFKVHMMLLDDDEYNEFVNEAIEHQHVTADYAVESALNYFSEVFAMADNEYMQGRASDIKDVSGRVLLNLSNDVYTLNSLNEKAIVCAYDLSPGDVVQFDKSMLLGFITAEGSISSHAAILAKSIGIPAIVAVGKDFMSEVSDNDFAIIDGISGKIILNPDDDTISQWKRQREEMSEQGLKRKNVDSISEISSEDEKTDDKIDSIDSVDVDVAVVENIKAENDTESCIDSSQIFITEKPCEITEPVVTEIDFDTPKEDKEIEIKADSKIENIEVASYTNTTNPYYRDKKIKIFANICGAEDVEGANFSGAEGIGLFRTEYIYLKHSDFPTESEQFEIYKAVAVGMKGKPVTVRTMDIGADKQVLYFNLQEEKNPAMGNRGIRLCFDKMDVFKTQLRALYRASIFGNLQIMFPMITSVDEVNKIKSICQEVKKELSEQHIPFNRNTKLGIMIETPAAAIISDTLAQAVDFFSIGTNDLTQYTLACDRQNQALEEFCNTHHEAILKLIEMTAHNAHKNNIPVGICGELANDISLCDFFVKIGIDELSVSIPYIEKLKCALFRY